VVLGFVARRYLTDRPEQAGWLAPADREWLSEEMRREQAERAQHHGGSVFGGVMTGKMALLCAIYFLNTCATYGIFLFLPKILYEATGYDGLKLAACSASPSPSSGSGRSRGCSGPSPTVGLLFLAAGLVMEALLVLSLRLPRRDRAAKAAAA
jgi:hypothetical protein